MINIIFDSKEEAALLLEVIGHVRMERMTLELRQFYHQSAQGVFTQHRFVMASSQYFMAHIEINPQETEYCLILKPRSSLALPAVRQIIDAYLRAKEGKGEIDLAVFSALLNEQGRRGIAYWQAHWQ